MTALRSVLEELNGHFKSHGRFINGSEITAGDCVVAPLLYQVEIVCNQLKVRALLCKRMTFVWQGKASGCWSLVVHLMHLAVLFHIQGEMLIQLKLELA